MRRYKRLRRKKYGNLMKEVREVIELWKQYFYEIPNGVENVGTWDLE